MNVTPMAFDYRGRKFLVGTSKECRMWLLDREALGGEDHRTTLHTTPLLCNYRLVGRRRVERDDGRLPGDGVLPAWSGAPCPTGSGRCRWC